MTTTTDGPGYDRSYAFGTAVVLAILAVGVAAAYAVNRRDAVRDRGVEVEARSSDRLAWEVDEERLAAADLGGARVEGTVPDSVGECLVELFRRAPHEAGAIGRRVREWIVSRLGGEDFVLPVERTGRYLVRLTDRSYGAPDGPVARYVVADLDQGEVVRVHFDGEPGTRLAVRLAARDRGGAPVELTRAERESLRLSVFTVDGDLLRESLGEFTMAAGGFVLEDAPAPRLAFFVHQAVPAAFPLEPGSAPRAPVRALDVHAAGEWYVDLGRRAELVIDPGF
ncbi:MAG: hypothetical protein R3F34_17175 [Planctomycetota bacterium]